MQQVLLLIFLVIPLFFVQTQKISYPIDCNQSQLSQTSFLDTIPFQFIHDNIIIEATFDGYKGNFVLDTGAPTVLSQSFYKKLNITPTGYIRVRDAGNQVQEQAYLVLPQATIQTAQFWDIPALIMDLEQTPLKDSPIKIDGLIGSNQLKDVVLQIDFAKKVLILSDNAQQLGLHKKEGLKIKLDDTKRPFVKVNVSGKKAEVLIDTGFNGLYAMPMDFFRFHQKHFMQHALKKGRATSSYTGLYGDATDETLPLIRCPYLEIGDVVLEKVVTLPYPGREGLLGTELLEEGVMTIDYVEKRFYFSKL